MKKRKSPGDRLILVVAKHRENATLRKLAHSRMSGALLEQAKAETAGLVVFEPIYHNGRRSRSQAARLTQRGIWQAIRLTRGYDPALAAAALATTDIRAVLARLEAERNPLAAGDRRRSPRTPRLTVPRRSAARRSSVRSGNLSRRFGTSSLSRRAGLIPGSGRS